MKIKKGSLVIVKNAYPGGMTYGDTVANTCRPARDILGVVWETEQNKWRYSWIECGLYEDQYLPPDRLILITQLPPDMIVFFKTFIVGITKPELLKKLTTGGKKELDSLINGFITFTSSQIKETQDIYAKQNLEEAKSKALEYLQRSANSLNN